MVVKRKAILIVVFSHKIPPYSYLLQMDFLLLAVEDFGHIGQTITGLRSMRKHKRLNICSSSSADFVDVVHVNGEAYLERDDLTLHS